MFKVTIVCSSLVRLGPTNVMFNMLEAYCKKTDEAQFEIVTISPEPEDSRIQEFLRLGIKVECANIKPGISGILHIKRLKEFVLSTYPDIVHSYGFRADIMLSLMDLGKIPKVSSLFNNPYDDYMMQFGKGKGFLMAVSHIRALKSFDKVIVCSEFIKSKIDGANLRLSVIYTGVPSDYFVPLNKAEREIRRSSLNIPQHAKVYLFIGNLIPRKNPQFLIDAFKAIGEEDMILIVMGDGPLMKDCVQHVGENKQIRLIGAQKGTLNYLQIADYYISASYSEGFPTAVLEAMSVNVFPILSDIQPHIEMVKDFAVKPIFENNNFESLFKELNKSKVVNISPRDILLASYSARRMQQNYINEYKWVLNNRLNN